MEEQVEVEEQVEGDSRSREWRLHRCEERVGRSGSVSALTSAQELCRYCCCSACRCCNLSATRQQSAARKSSSAERAAPGERRRRVRGCVGRKRTSRVVWVS